MKRNISTELNKKDKEFIPCFQPYFWGNEGNFVNEAINEGWISSRGKFIDILEQKFAKTIGTEYAVAVCNGTSALHLALAALEIQPGDEIIVPNFCMIAPVFAILYCGAIPVSVEIDETWNIDPDLIRDKITPKTRAILVVHNYGHPAKMDQITEIAQRNKLLLIEDAAEALGATLGDKMIGSFGDISCFSLYANKLITTGEGGMLVTNNPTLYSAARRRRDMSFGITPETRYIHDEVAWNYRMTNLQAAVGAAQIEYFDEAVERKIAIALRYRENLKDLISIQLPPKTSWGKNVYWTFGIVLKKEFGVSRSDLQKKLYSSGIDTRRFFTPLHKQPVILKQRYLEKPAIGSNEFIRSSTISEHGLCLPSYIGLKDCEIDRITETIRNIHSRREGSSI